MSNRMSRFLIEHEINKFDTYHWVKMSLYRFKCQMFQYNALGQEWKLYS